MADLKITNPEQLKQLRFRFAHIQGALALAQNARETADQMVVSYLETVALIAGTTFTQGQRIEVDWETGEVTVADPPTFQMPELNGAAVDA